MDNGGEIVSTGGENRLMVYLLSRHQDWGAEPHASIFNLLLCIFLEQIVFWSFLVDKLMLKIEPQYQHKYHNRIIVPMVNGHLRLLCYLSEAFKE